MSPFGLPLADYWQRVLAKIIDAIVVAVPGFILFIAIALNEIQDRVDAGDSGIAVSFGGRTFTGSFLWALIGLVYFSVLNGRGQTLGKMALGIKVVGADTGAPVGTGKGFVRHIVPFLASIVSCPGLIFTVLDNLWPLWDNKRQALHDKIAGSLVVKTR